PMRTRPVTTLSGGELQRTFLAQVFAQDPQVLILDEPANHLDLVYQDQIFHLVGQWRKEGERTVLSVVHDLSMAKLFGTHGLLLDQGRQVAFGRAEEVFTSKNLDGVYGMDVKAHMTALLKQWE